MSSDTPYFPHSVFGKAGTGSSTTPRVIIFPGRYIQGPGVLGHLGSYLSLLPSKKPAILITDGGRRRFGEQLERNLSAAGVSARLLTFKGECSYEAVNHLADSLKQEKHLADAVIAVGGGKCLDAAKCVAFRCGVPVVICPTIASTDAPCSAVSVMYTEEGVGIGPEFFPHGPSLVVVDTQIIAHSPVRHLISGMGDALATFYEARTNAMNPAARSMVGARPTITVLALAELCANTVLEYGLDAVAAMADNTVNEALEKVVEANTLLSGVGFESGGLAAAHAIASGLTVITALHKDFLHGELVGMGLLAQLILEGQHVEAQRIAEFLVKVGLPAHAGQLNLDISKDEKMILTAMAGAIQSQLTHAEPFDVSKESLYSAFCDAHELGMKCVAASGDQAYLKLHAHIVD